MSKKARTLPWVPEKEAGSNPLSPCDLSLEKWSLILQHVAYIIFLERKNSLTTSDTARFFSSTS
jgi:hypothetical protein